MLQTIREGNIDLIMCPCILEEVERTQAPSGCGVPASALALPSDDHTYTDKRLPNGATICGERLGAWLREVLGIEK